MKNLILITPVIIGFSVVLYYIPVWNTEKLLKKEAKTMCRHNIPGDAFDSWDTKIRYTSSVYGDDMVLECITISAGRDGRFETDDDIKRIALNLNKSKMIGAWAGQKAKQATKGFISSSTKGWLD